MLFTHFNAAIQHSQQRMQDRTHLHAISNSGGDLKTGFIYFSLRYKTAAETLPTGRRPVLQ